jgi:hypothetical protein
MIFFFKESIENDYWKTLYVLRDPDQDCDYFEEFL